MQAKVGGLFAAVKSLFKPAAADVPAHIRHRRFLSDNPMLYRQAVEAAEAYVSRLQPGDLWWLHAKPYDPRPGGSAQFFRLMYDLLNILQAMQLPPNARILEIGSGPGWITEILLMLGHTVDALEPSADLIAVARERCAGLEPHFRYAGKDTVRFHKATLEEIEFEPDSFDAVLYFDVLHHIVDEHVAIEKTFRFLKPGGRMGVVEAAWHPDFRELEAGLIKEMEEYGTLENPFSAEYLDHLLAAAGFTEVERYAGVNGFFSQAQLGHPLQHYAPPLYGVNNVVARKPHPDDARHPPCTDRSARTGLRMALVRGGIDTATRDARLTVELENTGDTLLDHRPGSTGRVTLALRRGAPGAEGFAECMERHPLLAPLRPGEKTVMELRYSLPADAPADGWELDAIAEGAFWFSAVGVAGLPVGVVRG